MVRILSVLAFTACLMAQDYDVLLKNGHVIDPKQQALHRQHDLLGHPRASARAHRERAVRCLDVLKS